MLLDRINLAMLRAEDALGTPQTRRARVKRMRTQAVILFLLSAVLGALRYRSTQSKPGWIVFVGLVLFMFAGRIYYTTRRLRLMDNADR